MTERKPGSLITRRRAIIAGTLAVAVGAGVAVDLLTSGGSSHEVPFRGSNQIGVATHLGDFIDSSGIIQELDMMQRLGVGLTRTDFHPDVLQPEEGRWDFSRSDQIVTKAAQRGIRVVALLNTDSAPSWMAEGADPLVPTAQAYGQIARGVAKQYGENVLYEIGSEVDLVGDAPQAMEVGRYAGYLKISSTGIRDVCPNATIISAGITPYNNPVGWIRQLQEMGALDEVDLIGYHPYNGSQGLGGPTFDAIAQMYEITGKPIIFTEFGWSTFDGYGGVSSEDQAAYIGETFELVRRRQLPVKAACVYDLINDGPNKTNRNDNFGLYEYGTLQPKDAAYEVRTEAVLFAHTA